MQTDANQSGKSELPVPSLLWKRNEASRFF